MELILKQEISKRTRTIQDMNKLEDVKLWKIDETAKSKNGMPLVEIWNPNDKTYSRTGWKSYDKNHIGPLIGWVIAYHVLISEKKRIGDKGVPLKRKISKSLRKKLNIDEYINILNASSRETVVPLLCLPFQSKYRGYTLRVNLRVPTDKYVFDILFNEIKDYNSSVRKTDELNKLLSKRKKRLNNYPSDISENIVKFALFKKYKVMPCWDTDKGDLVIDKSGMYIRIEVKAYQQGPSSFGPKEEWDWLYFVDATETLNMNFKVYEIKLSNKNKEFQSLKMSKLETFGKQADSGRRPRIVFQDSLKPQLGEKCKLIFDGHISQLKYPI